MSTVVITVELPDAADADDVVGDVLEYLGTSVDLDPKMEGTVYRARVNPDRTVLRLRVPHEARVGAAVSYLFDGDQMRLGKINVVEPDADGTASTITVALHPGTEIVDVRDPSAAEISALDAIADLFRLPEWRYGDSGASFLEVVADRLRPVRDLELPAPADLTVEAGQSDAGLEADLKVLRDTNDHEYR